MSISLRYCHCGFTFAHTNSENHTVLYCEDFHIGFPFRICHVVIFSFQEALEKAENDKAMMEEEKKKLEKDVEKWEEEFKEQNNREPSEEEK